MWFLKMLIKKIGTTFLWSLTFFDFQRSFLFQKTPHFPPLLRKSPSKISHLQVKKMICCPPHQIPQLNPWLPQVTKVKSGCAWRISARCRSLKVACATAKGRTGRPSFQASGGWFYNRNGDSKLTAVKTTASAITFTWRWVKPLNCLLRYQNITHFWLSCVERQVLFNFFNVLEVFGNLAFFQCLSSTSWTFPDIVLSCHGYFFYLPEGLDLTQLLNSILFRVHSDSIVTQNDWTYQYSTYILNLSCGPKLPQLNLGPHKSTLLLRGTFHPGFLEANHSGQPGRLPSLWPRQCSEWSPQHSGPVAPPKSHGLADPRRKVGDILFVAASNLNGTRNDDGNWKEDTSFKTSFIISLIFHLSFVFRSFWAGQARVFSSWRTNEL